MRRTIFHGGQIHNGERFVECVVVNEEKGLVEFSGDIEDLPQNLKSGNKLVDIKNHLLLPGFIDAHIHVEKLGEKSCSLDLRSTRSISELQNKLTQFIS